MLVIDASAALNAAASAEGFSRLIDHVLVAPPLMWSEALSVLCEGQWRGLTTLELAISTRERIQTCPISRNAPPELYREAWRISEELGWAKTYDAEYVALARILGCSLLTIDKRLQRRAGRLISVIGPMDL
jgi:predicted nucleic acid-binding protein